MWGRVDVHAERSSPGLVRMLFSVRKVKTQAGRHREEVPTERKLKEAPVSSGNCCRHCSLLDIRGFDR